MQYEYIFNSIFISEMNTISVLSNVEVKERNVQSTYWSSETNKNKNVV